MLHLNLDIGDLFNVSEALKPAVEKALKEAAESLALQAHSHIVELVSKELHSSKDKYMASLSFSQVDENTWIINLDAKANWIEDGMKGHEMIDDLLKSAKAKIGKDGSRYMSIPFQHNKGKTSQTPAATDLTNTIKSELKKRNIPYGKIERDENGQAKLGKLHSFDITKLPLKNINGPGMGHGPIGAVRQGNTGIPFLKGINIYQKNVKGKDGKDTTQRAIMTFRTVSTKQKGSGKWGDCSG